MKPISLTIIVPVRSEEEVVLKTLKSIQDKVKIPHTVFVADDHLDPDDQTISLLKKNRKKFYNVRIIEKEPGDAHGFGPALVRAVKMVNTQTLVFVMADLADDLTTIQKMYEVMNKETVDVVVGCRYMKGAGKSGGPWLQGFCSRILNRVLMSISLIKTRDATNAFKLWRTERLKQIFPFEPEPSLAFSLQLTVLAANKRFTFRDLPVMWTGRAKGKSKFKIIKSGLPYLKWSIRALWDRLLA